MAKFLMTDHLKAISLFASLPKKQLSLIARSAEERVVRAGTTLVEQGQAGDEAYFIVEGEAAVRRNRRRVATLGPNAVVGELALLDRGPRTATVVARTDLTVLAVDRRNFLTIVQSRPGLANELLGALARRVRQLDRGVYG